MTEGTVKFYNRTKRFGFVTAEDGKDYFFHISGVKDEVVLNEGDKVKFDIVEGDKGPKAENIEKA